MNPKTVFVELKIELTVSNRDIHVSGWGIPNSVNFAGRMDTW